jgi:hypothetical protein
MLTVASLEHRAEQFRASGGSTLIYSMPGEIDGRGCDELSTVPGVISAGAIRTDPSSHIAASLPGQDIPSFAISPGFRGFRALGSPSRGSGVLVSTDLATTLGVDKGMTMTVSGAEATISDVFTYPADGRQPGYGYSLLIPTTTRDPFDSCWVEAWPADEHVAALLVTTLLPDAVSGEDAGSPGPQLTQLNTTLGRHFDGVDLYHERITVLAAFVAAAAAFALGYVSVRMRRLELASALHARVRKGDQTAQILFETLAWGLGGVVLTIPVYILIAGATETSNVGFLTALGLRVAATAAFALPGATLACVFVRENLLFAYFKGR